MKRSTAALVVFLATLISAAGCATGPFDRRPSASASSDVEELKRRVLELQRRAAVTEVELARLRQTLADLEARTRPSSPTPPPAAPPRREVVEPARPAPPVRIDERDLPELPAEPGAGVSPPAVSTVEPVTAQAQAAYDQAYTLYHQGRFIDAETAFRRFLQTWPRTDLSDNAGYWIGECRYSRGDLRAALAAFQEAVQRYPEGNKTADALYKAGQCLEGLGDVESARASYQAVLDRYATEPAADLARERLRALR